MPGATPDQLGRLWRWGPGSGVSQISRGGFHVQPGCSDLGAASKVTWWQFSPAVPWKGPTPSKCKPGKGEWRIPTPLGNTGERLYPDWGRWKESGSPGRVDGQRRGGCEEAWQEEGGWWKRGQFCNPRSRFMSWFCCLWHDRVATLLGTRVLIYKMKLIILKNALHLWGHRLLEHLKWMHGRKGLFWSGECRARLEGRARAFHGL